MAKNFATSVGVVQAKHGSEGPSPSNHTRILGGGVEGEDTPTFKI